MTRQEWLEVFAAAFLDERLKDDLPTHVEAVEILRKAWDKD